MERPSRRNHSDLVYSTSSESGGRFAGGRKIRSTEGVRALAVSPGRTDLDRSAHDLLTDFDRFVLYEDDDLLAVNKPPYIFSQGADRDGVDMVDIARFMRNNYRIGVAHRLDTNTSGILVFGKSLAALRGLGAQFESKEASRIEKRYAVLLEGTFKDRNPVRVEVPLDETSSKVVVADTPRARHSITIYTPVTLYQRPDGSQVTLADAHIITGRKHQIRVVAAGALGMPVVGDYLYNSDPSGARRQMLHARSLQFEHPVTGEPIHLVAPLPEDFQQVLSGMKVVTKYRRSLEAVT